MTNKEFIDKIDNTHWCYIFCLAFLPYMFLALFLVRDVALGYVRSFNAPAADKLLHYSWAANGFPLNILLMLVYVYAFKFLFARIVKTSP